MARRRKRESESEYRASEEEDEGEETTSKPTSVTDDGLRSSAKSRRTKREKGNEADMTTVRDLIVSLKQLAEVRLRNAGEESLAACLTPASLRTIGIILEEFIKDRMLTEYLPLVQVFEKEMINFNRLVKDHLSKRVERRKVLEHEHRIIR